MPLGSVYEDEFGSEFQYLQGIGSTLVGSAVSIPATFITALLVNGAVGPVGFAMAAILASQFGWYCTKNVVGTCPAQSNAAVAINTALYSTATGGKIDDLVAANNLIVNAFATTAAGSATSFTVRCAYPFVSNTIS